MERSEKMAGKAQDLTGLVFGRWKVLERAENRYYSNGRQAVYSKCQCQCSNGTIRDVLATTLKTGKSVSCGCYQKEIAAQTIAEVRNKYNAYVVHDDYVILYTYKNEPFFVDIEDFGRIHKYCWHKNDNGYLVTTINHTTVYLHRMIMNALPNIDVDHEHGSSTKHDNRKSNLRLATISQNGMNKEKQSNNTSGYVGVSWSKKSNKWRSRICINKKEIFLGEYVNIQDAIDARRKAEEKYFGKFGYKQSRGKEREE